MNERVSYGFNEVNNINQCVYDDDTISENNVPWIFL